jgi:hypothetical protein
LTGEWTAGKVIFVMRTILKSKNRPLATGRFLCAHHNPELAALFFEKGDDHE